MSLRDFGSVISQDTIARLVRHAGLEGGPDPETVSGCTVPGPTDEQQLDAALDDYLDALQSLSAVMNGEPPSETLDGANDVPRAVAYAASEVESMLRQAGVPERAELAATAWNMVLAGDVDDIAGEARQELTARRS